MKMEIPVVSTLKLRFPEGTIVIKIKRKTVFFKKDFVRGIS